MQTDRELLELAAKAAGIDLTNAAPSKDGTWIFRTPKTPNWNPLNDDGDALRLAVKLNILIYQTGLDGAYASTPMNWSCVERDGEDQCAKTRRAIVRAAAEVGRAMPATPGDPTKE